MKKMTYPRVSKTTYTTLILLLYFMITSPCWAAVGDREDYAEAFPLHQACKEGDVKQVEELLRNNPNLNINQPDKFGRTPLEIAREEGHNGIVTSLEEQMKAKKKAAICKACSEAAADFEQSNNHFSKRWAERNR